MRKGNEHDLPLAGEGAEEATRVVYQERRPRECASVAPREDMVDRECFAEPGVVQVFRRESRKAEVSS